LNNVLINNNKADEGGGLCIEPYNQNGFPVLEDVSITFNEAYSRGGGIWVGESGQINDASSILIVDNFSVGHGGGIFLSAGSNINLQQSTIANNMVGEGDVFGAGIYSDGGTANLTNSIVYYNRREGDFGINYNLNGYTMDMLEEYNVSYSDIEGDENWIPVGEGNISINPEFVDHEYNDYTLQAGSPCIDIGIVLEDMEYCDDAPDMGAYEYCVEECGAELADVTGDAQINVLDLVQISYYVLELSTPAYPCAADYNQDGQVNILDLVQIANYILEN
jgi:hypothetical protein